MRALTPDRLAEIRALAEAALRESVACGDDEDTWWEGPEASVSASDAIFPAARDHVVAASPDVVLALVREALAGRAAIDAWEALDAAVSPNRPATGEPGSAWFRRMNDLATAARALSREYHAALAGPVGK